MMGITELTDQAATERITSRSRFVWRLAVAPLRIVVGVVSAAFRTGIAVGRFPMRVGAAASKRLGAVGTVCLVVGVVVGLLVAPTSGRQLRERLRLALSGGGRDADRGPMGPPAVPDEVLAGHHGALPGE
jgi:hypothetical protein